MEAKVTSLNVTVVDKAKDTEVAFDAKSDQPVLLSIRSVVGSPIPVGCKGGGCGVCKVRVLEGNFSAKRMSKAHISEQDLEENVVLACRIIPETDLKVEILAETPEEDKS